MRIGKAMRVVAVAVASEGVQVVVGGGEEGRVEVRSRLRRGPRRGAVSFWMTRLLPTSKMGP